MREFIIGYLFEILIAAALLGIIPGAIAERKGHSFGVWWLYGWLLFIAAMIHVLFISNDHGVSRSTGITIKIISRIIRVLGSVAAAVLARFVWQIVPYAADPFLFFSGWAILFVLGVGSWIGTHFLYQYGERIE